MVTCPESSHEEIDFMTDSDSSISTGVEHWEQQRRKWTEGFVQRVDSENDDVDFLLYPFD